MTCDVQSEYIGFSRSTAIHLNRFVFAAAYQVLRISRKTYGPNSGGVIRERLFGEVLVVLIVPNLDGVVIAGTG